MGVLKVYSRADANDTDAYDTAHAHAADEQKSIWANEEVSRSADEHMSRWADGQISRCADEQSGWSDEQSIWADELMLMPMLILNANAVADTDTDADALTPSSNTRGYTCQSVLSSLGQ